MNRLVSFSLPAFIDKQTVLEKNSHDNWTIFFVPGQNSKEGQIMTRNPGNDRRHGIPIGLSIEGKEAMLALATIRITMLSQSFATSSVELEGAARWQRQQEVLDEIGELLAKARRLVTDLSHQSDDDSNVSQYPIGLARVLQDVIDRRSRPKLDVRYTHARPDSFYDERRSANDSYLFYSGLREGSEPDRNVEPPKEDLSTEPIPEKYYDVPPTSDKIVDSYRHRPDLGLSVRGGEYGEDDLGSR